MTPNCKTIPWNLLAWVVVALVAVGDSAAKAQAVPASARSRSATTRPSNWPRMPLADENIPRLRQLTGLGTMVDLGLSPYYRNRDPRGLAKEIRARGFTSILAYGHTLSAETARAFREEGLAIVLQLWGTIIYSPQAVQPPPPDNARQVFLKGPQDPQASPVFFCPNSDSFIAWHREFSRQQLDRLDANVDAVLIIEAFMGDLPGPEAATYGCFCRHCLQRFKRAYPKAGGFPEFTDANSPRYWRKNRELYEQFVQFRVDSLTRFLQRAYGSVVRMKPALPIVGTMLALDEPDGIARIRECNAQDVIAIARAAPWDLFYLQAHWPDWIKSDLRPDHHVRSYVPFLKALREQTPGMRVGVLTDSGSNENMRRSMDWLKTGHDAARAEGYSGLAIYEYAISRFIYEDLPQVIEHNVNDKRGEVELVFSKRLEATSAGKAENYTLDDNTHPTRVAFDGGNIVTLRFARWKRGRADHLAIQNIRDDAATFWFNVNRSPDQWKYPPNQIAPDTRVKLHENQ